MNNNSLRKHYTQKYSSEKELEPINLIPLTKFPVTRSEACVKYFSTHFKGGSILELGAGNGSIAKTLLASDLKIENYTLTEISPPRISALRKNLTDSRVNILNYDAENIPSSEYGKYDIVIMVALIEHLIDPIGAMRSIRQVLKPNGIVYIDTPNIAKYSRRIKLLLGRFPSTASRNEGLTTYDGNITDLYDEGHLHYFTYRSLSLMLTHHCGFTNTTNLGYASNIPRLVSPIFYFLSQIWPDLFSEISMITKY